MTDEGLYLVKNRDRRPCLVCGRVPKYLTADPTDFPTTAFESLRHNVRKVLHRLRLVKHTAALFSGDWSDHPGAYPAPRGTRGVLLDGSYERPRVIAD